MKKLIALGLTAVMSLSLAACGASAPKETEPPKPKEVTESNNILVNGIYVDDSYRDKDNSPLRMVYLFTTVKATDNNLKVSASTTIMKIGDTNTYTSEKFQGTGKYTPNWYHSSYIKDVYVGDEKKILTTFKVPEGELSEEKEITLSGKFLPGCDQLLLNTKSIQHCSGEEAIASAMDPEGYADIQKKREEADAQTTAKVKSLINGYYYNFYVNSTSYKIEFEADNIFTVTAMKVSNSGTYTVRNGYIFCTYPGTGYTVEIPYELNGDDIELDLTTAFDVK